MKPSDLSDEALRIRVAELLGYKKRILEFPKGLCVYDHKGNTISEDLLPDWPHDLNACHEMENVLAEEQRDLYGCRLAREAAPVGGERWACATATARQRCEAFAATMEEKP